MNLSLLVIVPLITTVLLLFARGQNGVRRIALAGVTVQLVLSFVLLVLYWQERAAGGTAAGDAAVGYTRAGEASVFLFQYRHAWFSALHIDYYVGVDGISVAMILLTAFVMMGAILVSWKIASMTKEFFVLLLLLSAGAYGFFISLDLFTLFFFLEVSVIPKFLLIGIWGSGRKEYAAMKLALMLMAGSALVFIGLLGLYYNTGAAGVGVPGAAGGYHGAAGGPHTFDWPAIAQMQVPVKAQLLFFPFLFTGFGVFTALFPFHTWVPDGHSSAPTAASMFLAGISMKLGGYGCLRVAIFLMPAAAREYSPFIIGLATIAIVYGAFATMMQKDLKYINAYSSVSHCGFILLGIGMLTRTAVNGAVMQMISHGLMTALFFAAIGMIYDRTHTRMVERLGGLLKIMPFISTIFVIAGLCSLGLPGLSGFVAEITVFMGSWQHPGGMYHLATILACASIVVTAVYILRATGQTIMGPVNDPQYNGLTDATWNERLAGIVLAAGIIAIGVAPFWLNELINK